MVTLSEETLRDLLSGCPAIESLLLDQNVGVSCLRISSPTLRSIGFRALWNGQVVGIVNVQEMVIEDAPCLERLLPLNPDYGPVTIRVIRAPKLKILGSLSCGILLLQLRTTVFKEMIAVSLTIIMRTVKVLGLDNFGPGLNAALYFLKCSPCLERLYVVIPSASGTTPSEEEQGDEDLDAERGLQGEEDEYEEGARGQEGEDVEEEVHQEGEEVPGKAIWIRGPASLPDAPRTENNKLVVYLEKPEALGLVARTGHRPSGILTCILKKYWPGLYRVSPNAPKKLALKWEDYQAAPYGVFATEDGREHVPTCAHVVLKTFWDFYKLSADTDQQEATRVLQLMAKKNLKDIFYHARNLAILHYYAEQGKRRNKDRVIAENLTIEEAAGWERVNLSKMVPE
ncbi:hypothetical protein ACQ4PT_039986 [Festuca glaucescens]